MAQNGPKMAPSWPKIAPRWPKMAPDGTKTAQVGPKMVPRWSQEGPREPKMGSGWLPGAACPDFLGFYKVLEAPARARGGSKPSTPARAEATGG